MNKQTQRPRPEQHHGVAKSPPTSSGYTREDLRRDTYVPASQSHGSPRAHEFASNHDD
jgi:hypothetical protein